MPLVSTTFRCDVCDKLVEVEGSMQPENWVLIQQQSVRALACSWACTKKFVQVRIDKPDPTEDQVEVKS